MRRVTSFLFVAVAIALFNCSHGPAGPESPAKKGAVEMTVHIGQAGKLGKTMKTATIEMTNLYVVLSAEGQNTVYDTLALSGGSRERTEEKTYSGLTAWIDGQFIHWTLSIEARDQNGRTIHSGDTTFVLLPLDTVEIPLFLDAMYSMLVAGFFPIRDSVTRCALVIDGDSQADTSFAAQSLVGDTVTLSFDYLTASPSGTSHHIDMNVYGSNAGNEMLLYSGDTTIAVKSGENANYTVVLDYVGPVADSGAMAMTVTLGSAGKVSLNGILSEINLYILTTESRGTGTVNGTANGWSVTTHGVSYALTAAPGAGYHFVVWRVTSGTARIADSTAASTTITLENGDATVSAVFAMGFRRIYGGNGTDIGYSVQQTNDGGFIITGRTASSGAGADDVYLIKTNSAGVLVWSRTFGGAGGDCGNSILQADDGGYLIAGYTSSSGAGSNDVYLIKTNA